MTIWVLAGDASRARIFETQSRLGELTEVEDLVHPSSRLPEQELVSDSPGMGRTHPPGGGPGHSVGHEEDAAAEERDRFAREVAGVLRKAREGDRFHRLHVLAAPRFLGALRQHLDEATRELVVSEHDVHVITETAAAIRARLPERL